MSDSGAIFISYRRQDSEDVAGRIYDRLCGHFPREKVFFDIDTIPLGADFREYIDQEVSQCQIFLALIGKSWLTVTDEDGTPRLKLEQDFVRLEIESALNRKIPVIPLLVSGGKMPKKASLPSSLESLIYRNGISIRSGRDFHKDMDDLIAGIDKQFRRQPPPPVKPKANKLSEDLGNGVILELVKIPGGEFLMGSNESEDEQPQHRVKISPFMMGKYPVTQAQWKAVMGNNPSKFKGDRRPVETVSWNDAVEFCDRLYQMTGKEYRLPSESEWEYACRAGRTTKYSFGDEINTDHANINKAVGETLDVGTYSPNAFGLYDMHGNVWEWCLDHWHQDYQGAPNDGSAWVTGGDSDFRIRRGGSWFSDPGCCRSAYRYYDNPVVRYSIFGFRVSCSSPRALP